MSTFDPDRGLPDQPRRLRAARRRADRGRSGRGGRRHPAVGVARADHRDPGRTAETAGRRAWTSTAGCRRRDRHRRRSVRGCAGPRKCSESCCPPSTPDRRCRFRHRPSRAEPYTERTLEPWGVVTDEGTLVSGRPRPGPRRHPDVPAVADRCGRAKPSGRQGAVTRPDGVNLRDIVADAVGEAPTGVTGRGVGGRRAGHGAAARRNVEWCPRSRRRPGRRRSSNWTSGTADRLAREIAGYGADAVVLEPAVAARGRGGTGLTRSGGGRA